MKTPLCALSLDQSRSQFSSLRLPRANHCWQRSAGFRMGVSHHFGVTYQVWGQQYSLPFKQHVQTTTN